MVIAVAILVVGLVVLVWSADRLVFGAAAIAKKLRRFAFSDRNDHFGNGLVGPRNDGVCQRGPRR